MIDRPALVGAEIPAAFDAAADRYDLMVALNPGYHRHLRAAANALVDKLPRNRPVGVVDLGCGSGASTAALVAALTDTGRSFQLVGYDGSAGMLDHARRKRWPHGVRFEQRLAEDLASPTIEHSPGGSVDGVLAAYLFRNVSDRDQVLAAVYELLGPGGTLVVQEYSVAGSGRARLVWSTVCWLVVIPLSWVLSRDTRLYRYLWRSVQQNEMVGRFTDRMHAAGFVEVEVSTVRGWQHRILHTIRGRRSR